MTAEAAATATQSEGQPETALQHNWPAGEAFARDRARVQALAEAARQQGAAIADDITAELAYVEQRWPGRLQHAFVDDEQAAARAYLEQSDAEVGQGYAREMEAKGLAASDVTDGAWLSMDGADPELCARVDELTWESLAARWSPSESWSADAMAGSSHGTDDPWADQ